MVPLFLDLEQERRDRQLRRRDRRAALAMFSCVGGGPAGLARILGERGHAVTLFEAGTQLGGQLILAAVSPRRRDLRGIVDWRAQELDRLGVTVRLGTFAEPDQLATGWDVVIVATGGMPGAPDVPGGQHVMDGWDILSGAKRVAGRVLVYDDHGGNQALDVSEAILRTGAGSVDLEFVTPERTVSPDVGGIVVSGYVSSLAQAGARITVLRRLRGIRRAHDGGPGLVVSLGVEGSEWTEERVVDAVVAETGTEPATDVYDDLVPGSSNGGQVDLADFLSGLPQTAVRNTEGTYQLFRIGDAVASRNVHAAMLDAVRLCRQLG